MLTPEEERVLRDLTNELVRFSTDEGLGGREHNLTFTLLNIAKLKVTISKLETEIKGLKKQGGTEPAKYISLTDGGEY